MTFDLLMHNTDLLHGKWNQQINAGDNNDNIQSVCIIR